MVVATMVIAGRDRLYQEGARDRPSQRVHQAEITTLVRPSGRGTITTRTFVREISDREMFVRLPVLAQKQQPFGRHVKTDRQVVRQEIIRVRHAITDRRRETLIHDLPKVIREAHHVRHTIIQTIALRAVVLQDMAEVALAAVPHPLHPEAEVAEEVADN